MIGAGSAGFNIFRNSTLDFHSGAAADPTPTNFTCNYM
jgi:hypothetical protein